MSLVNPASLFGELKRRRVFRALIGYGIAAFAVLQIIEPVMHGLHWPEDVLSYVVVALAVGFPIIVSLAWIFDVKAGRIERTAPAVEGLTGARLVLFLVAIGVLAATPGTIWYFAVRGIARRPTPTIAAPEQSARSIAVLPFADMSPGKDQEYFSDGVAEEILNALAHVENLRVIGRTSSFSFKGKNEDLRTIGQKLNVSTILEGSVRKSGDRIRITTQLINASDGSHVWSDTYDRNLTDVFAVQGEIARSIVEALKVKLMPATFPTSKSGQPLPEAYLHYMLGRQLWYRDAPNEAIAAFQKAVEIDPQFAAAWAAMSPVFGDVAVLVGTREAWREGCKRQRDTAEKAVALDPGLAEGFSARGLTRSNCYWDWAGAAADYDRALTLSPGDSASQRRHGINELVLGRTSQSIGELRKATEIDPLMPFNWSWLARAYMASGQLDLARRAVAHELEVSPELKEGAAYFSAAISILEGHPAAALAALATIKPRYEIDQLRLLALAHYDLGHAAEAQQALDALVAKFPQMVLVGPSVARVYAWRGDRERAFEWLEKAYLEHDPELDILKWNPFLRKLRGDKRYAALLRKMNLPPD